MDAERRLGFGSVTTIDPFLPFFVCPASGDECYVVRGRSVGQLVEISLTRDRQPSQPVGPDRYATLELLALKRFPYGDVSAYAEYAASLEDAARYAARGELGYSVHTITEDGAIQVSLVARLLRADGRVETEISHEHRFDAPDSHVELVQANEKATELSALAQDLNDQWASRRAAELVELREEYETADAQADAADELHRIVDSEGD